MLKFNDFVSKSIYNIFHSERLMTLGLRETYDFICIDNKTSKKEILWTI